MKNIVIIGAGGFGREVQWLVEQINKESLKKVWNLVGYIDDNIKIGTVINGIKVLGGVDLLLEKQDEIYVVCAVGSVKIRKNIIEKLINSRYIKFPNLIDPNVIMSDNVSIGQGNIICAGCILTVNINLSNFGIINLDCTIGHDVLMEDYVTLYPGIHVSGCVEIGTLSEIGTGTQIIQGKHICKETIIGAGAVVIKDIDESGTYVGNPARRVK